MSHKTKFTEMAAKLYEKKAENTAMLTVDGYNNLVTKLIRLKETGPSSSDKSDYYAIKQYDLQRIDSSYKIINKKTEKTYVHMEEIFDCIQTAHHSTGHGGRQITLKLLKQKYSNITQELVTAFLEGCENCQLKRKKRCKVKPIVSDYMNSRCQVDLIDLQTRPDGDFKFILVYQDHLTKYIRLRPLKNKTAINVAHELLDIFADLGAPCVLQSDNGREFANQIVEELLNMWPECHMVHGKPRHSQGSGERVNRDIEVKLASWMKNTGITRWSEGLRFVQFSKNRCFHSGIGRSPYEAMFGVVARNGLTNLPIPPHFLENIRSEEDLERLLQSSSNDAGEEDSTLQEIENDALSLNTNTATAIIPKTKELLATSSTANATQSGNEVVTCHAVMSPLVDISSITQQIKEEEGKECEDDTNNIILETNSESFLIASNGPGLNTNPESKSGNLDQNCSMCLNQGCCCSHKEHVRRSKCTAQKRQAERMLQTSKKRLNPGEVGMTVRIPTPETF